MRTTKKTPTPSNPTVHARLAECAGISDRSWRSDRNSAEDREIIVRHPTVGVLRFHVHLDRSYDFQSRASAEVWVAAGWTEVHRLAGVLVRDIDSTLSELARVALLVLGGAS